MGAISSRINTLCGDGVAKSEFEATRWFRKAAAQGHPGALIDMSCHCLEGIGCKRDVAESRKYAEKAMLLRASLVDAVKEGLAGVALDYIETESTDMIEAAKTILIPLARDGLRLAQYNLGVCFYNTGQYGDAKPWHMAAALQEDRRAAFYAMECCGMLEEHSQQRFWLSIASKWESLTDVPEYKADRIATMDHASDRMRRLRDECGGCGAALDGKVRKICKGCKTYCYCDRNCQKLHWNRLEGGHRADCLEVLDLKKKFKQMEKREG